MSGSGDIVSLMGKRCFVIKRKIREMDLLKKHIFLTGNVQVGKSTIIRRLLATEWFCRKKIGGFRTISQEKFVYIMGANQSLADCSEKNICGRRYMDRFNIESYPDVFDEVGCGFLQDVQGVDIILMDELGFLEARSYRFQHRVLEILDGEIPVIGVVKPKHDLFLDRIRNHPAVEIVEITPENREEKLNYITSRHMNRWNISG